MEDKYTYEVNTTQYADLAAQDAILSKLKNMTFESTHAVPHGHGDVTMPKKYPGGGIPGPTGAMGLQGPPGPPGKPPPDFEIREVALRMAYDEFTEQPTTLEISMERAQEFYEFLAGIPKKDIESEVWD